MLALFVVLFLIIIDQLSKFFILKNFHPGDSFPIIKNIFHISLVLNKGIAFGIFSQIANSIFIWISIIFVLIIIFFLILYRNILRRRKASQVFLSLILAGAIGNLIDRLRFGFVIDFLDLRIWPVFNIADSAITIGAILLLLQIIKHKSVLSHKS